MDRLAGRAGAPPTQSQIEPLHFIILPPTILEFLRAHHDVLLQDYFGL